MLFTSPAFQNFQIIPKKYTCDGDGDHPPFAIGDISEDAKSLVLIVDDPDAPGGTYDHWVVWNISPETREIEEDSVPEGAIEGMNSAGEVGWVAPCPPSGIHHYRFNLYALSKTLQLSSGADRDTVERAMEDFVIERAELVGQYSRDFGGSVAEEGLQ